MASPLRGDSPIRGGSPVPEGKGKSDKKIEESEDRKRVKEASEVLKGRAEAAPTRKPPTRKARELKGFDKNLKSDTSPEKAAEVAKEAETLKPAEPKKKPAGGVSMFGGGHNAALQDAMARRAEGKSIKGKEEKVDTGKEEKAEPKKKEPLSELQKAAKRYEETGNVEEKSVRDKKMMKRAEKHSDEHHNVMDRRFATDTAPSERPSSEKPVSKQRDATIEKKPLHDSPAGKEIFEKSFGKYGGPIGPAKHTARVVGEDKQPDYRAADSDDEWAVHPKGKGPKKEAPERIEPKKEPKKDDDEDYSDWVDLGKKT